MNKKGVIENLKLQFVRSIPELTVIHVLPMAY